MSDASAIEWTDTTWNPTTGCDRVSPGCDHCYALTLAKRLKGMGAAKYQRDGDPRTSGPGFGLTTHEDTLRIPLTWRKPRKVFVNSMSDLFHDAVPNRFIADVFAVMAATPQHTYQVLTKRHGRMRSLLGDGTFRAAVEIYLSNLLRVDEAPLSWPLPNVWLGVSVEDQKRADLRIPALMQTPAAVRFLSCEPLLGPIDLCGPIIPGRGRPKLTYWLDGRPGWGPEQTDDRGRIFQQLAVGPRIDWVIVGGESGRDAQPMHPAWARSLRDQCTAADVPFFFKQWGEWGPAPFIVRVPIGEDGRWHGTDAELEAAKRDAEAKGATHVHTGNWHVVDGERKYWPPYEMDHKPWSLERAELTGGMAPIRRWGKGRAGRELDGRTWDEYPQAVAS